MISIPANGTARVSWVSITALAAGMFLHVATDFLPRCETGSEISEVAQKISKEANTLLDRLRLHAVVSTAPGGIVVFASWAALAV